MKNIKIGVWLLIGLISSAVQAQNTNLMLLEENLEQLATEAESTDWEDELEELSHRLTQKLNLNTATRQQLEMFPFLSDIQVENLLAYVYVHGDMQTLYELQLVEEMDKATIERLLPFVCVVPSREEEKFPSLKRILKYGKHEATARFDVPFYTRKGYETSYLGPSLYHSLRYNFRYSDRLQVGVTGEKDAGEPFFALHDRQGYDYYSFYLLMKDCGRLQTLAVGNYKASFGQGLVLGNSFGFGKTFSLATTENRTEGFRKHSSSDEYNYFRRGGGYRPFGISLANIGFLFASADGWRGGGWSNHFHLQDRLTSFGKRGGQEACFRDAGSRRKRFLRKRSSESGHDGYILFLRPSL